MNISGHSHTYHTLYILYDCIYKHIPICLDIKISHLHLWSLASVLPKKCTWLGAQAQSASGSQSELQGSREKNQHISERQTLIT